MPLGCPNPWLVVEGKYQLVLHFWPPSVHIPKDKQSILTHDQVNFETAEIQPYLSVLTFILLAFIQGQCLEQS